MSVIDTLLSDIDEAIRGKGERRRHALLRRTTATLIDQLADLNDHHLAIFDDVLISLALEVEAEARAALAERLADLNRAPKKTIRALALDDNLTVARPIIERSVCLDEETLSYISREKNTECLALIARRRSLPAPIADILIERADETLLVDIARNEATPISDKALRLLAERALRHHTLYRVLRTRPDLSLRHIGAMIEAARHRAQIDAEIRIREDDILSKALALETASLVARDSHLALSSRTQSGTAQSHELNSNTNETVLDFLERHQIDDALMALAEQAGLTTDLVKRVFHASHHEPLFYVLRSQNLPWETVRRFMQNKHGTMSDEFEAELNTAYCALASDTARRIATFMAERKPKSGAQENSQFPLSRSA